MFRKLHYRRQTGRRKVQTCRLDWYSPHMTQFFQPSEFFYQFICNVCNNKNTSGIPIGFPVPARFLVSGDQTHKKIFRLDCAHAFKFNSIPFDFLVLSTGGCTDKNQSRSQSPTAFWSAPRHGALE